MDNELVKLARYPFLKKAKGYVASLRISLPDIREHPLYSESVNLARQRVMDSMNDRIRVNTEDDLSCELSVLSYALARIIVHHTNNRMLLIRYASSEAGSACSFLRTEERETVNEVKGDLEFGLKDSALDFREYLKLTANLAKKDPKWKLVNRRMEKGLVAIEDEEKFLLLKEAIKLRVAEPIDTRGIPDSLKKVAGEFAGAYARRQPGRKMKNLDERSLPPCIRSMLASLDSGNVSHNERFILATFFFGAGLDIEEVLKIFSRYPQYNEEKTRYQLTFLTGERGATKYICPSCAKIKSYGLCKAECGIRHPLNYRRG